MAQQLVRPSASLNRASLNREIHFSGLPVPIEIFRHQSARRLTLRVSETRRSVTLTLPSGLHLNEGRRFVAKHLDWITTKLEQMPEAHPFVDGAIIPLRGVPHVVRFAGEKRAERGQRGVVWIEQPAMPAEKLIKGKAAVAKKNRAKITLAAIVLPKPPARLKKSSLPVLWVSGLKEHAPRRLQDWLMAEAQKDVSRRVRFHAEALGLKAKRVTVRDQSSRWGSCSSAGVLSFSWRLLLAPATILDYVAAHEVAHLKEMNHGPRFWKLLDTTYSRVEEARDWLTVHGASLHSYGAED